MKSRNKGFVVVDEERMVKAIRQRWHEIAIDMLQAVERETGEDTMSGEDAREVVADYIEEPGLWDLTHEKREELLLRSLPQESWCI